MHLAPCFKIFVWAITWSLEPTFFPFRVNACIMLIECHFFFAKYEFLNLHHYRNYPKSWNNIFTAFNVIDVNYALYIPEHWSFEIYTCKSCISLLRHIIASENSLICLFFAFRCAELKQSFFIKSYEPIPIIFSIPILDFFFSGTLLWIQVSSKDMNLHQ